MSHFAHVLLRFSLFSKGRKLRLNVELSNRKQPTAFGEHFCVRAAFSTTLFGVAFPLPTSEGTGIGNSGTSPRSRFGEGGAKQPSVQEATSANLFRKECQGCNEARKQSRPASQFNLPRRLSTPSQGSADRRLRPALAAPLASLCSTLAPFHWSNPNQLSFEALRKALMPTPVLRVWDRARSPDPKYD
jgi:hypothetical protein